MRPRRRSPQAPRRSARGPVGPRSASEAAAELEPTAVGLLGLEVVWWLGDVAASVRRRTAADAGLWRRATGAAAVASG